MTCGKGKTMETRKGLVARSFEGRKEGRKSV
jgi:hypothetical protein